MNKGAVRLLNHYNFCLTNLKINAYVIKVLIALVGRLSLSVGWENGPERGLKSVSFNL